MKFERLLALMLLTAIVAVAAAKNALLPRRGIKQHEILAGTGSSPDCRGGGGGSRDGSRA